MTQLEKCLFNMFIFNELTRFYISKCPNCNPFTTDFAQVGLKHFGHRVQKPLDRLSARIRACKFKSQVTGLISFSNLCKYSLFWILCDTLLTLGIARLGTAVLIFWLLRITTVYKADFWLQYCSFTKSAFANWSLQSRLRKMPKNNINVIGSKP